MRKKELLDARGSNGDRQRGGTLAFVETTRNVSRRAHEIRRPDEHESYPGETLVTTNHDVIRAWGRGPGREAERGLRFIFQEHTKDGSDSNFFRLENPDRDDD
jgi:hypothetical protein